ncbi:hypothetical protein MASR1M68_14550 [Elusimicrobiota bacterium]
MKKFLFALICLSVFVVSCEVKNQQDVTDNNFESADLVESGIEKMNQRDYQGAINDFTKASETDDDPDTLAFLAKAKSFAGDSKGALEAINKALDIKTERRHYVARAEIQLALKNFKDASSDIKKALVITDIDSWPYFILSKINFESGNNQEALDNIKTALSKGNDIESNKVLYYVHMADIKYATKDYQGALDALTQAIDKAESLKGTEEGFSQDQISEFYNKRWKIKLDMGDKAGAEEDARKAKSFNQ